MNSQILKSIAIGTSLLLTLTVGAPAVADDTELLVVDPSNTVATSPNIMFILDTSGSMNDPVDSTEPYDSAIDYSAGGDCGVSKIYWTTIDVVPACLDGSGNANTQYVDKTSFLCADAVLRMSGIGAYTGVMVQHRSDGSGAARWQQFEIGNASDPVECQNDSGVHGGGVSGDVYAMAGSGQPQFTSDSGSEISWGSGDAAQVYTAYDGNYLNWKENPVVSSIPKMTIMKAVTKNLMNAIEDVNVGLMRFNDSDGGRIVHAISDLDADRAAVLAKIQALTGGGRTPLAESLYESALYWRGMNADYGDFTTTTVVDPTDSTIITVTQSPADVDTAAFVAGVPGTYQQPSLPVCTRNFNVLLTDGEPVNDTDAQTKAPTLPFFSSLGRTSCDGTGEGRCLDDVAEYLSKVSISADVNNPQTVVTHTIGFAINLPILADAAAASGGDYYLADDVETLTTALMRIVENILDKGLSFSAPTVAVNTFNRTQNLNDLYISTFLPDSKVHWPGNLKKYTIDAGIIKDSSDPARDAVDPDTGFFQSNAKSYWTAGTADGSDVLLGGAANKLPDPVDRNVYTNYGLDNALSTGASNAIDTGNSSLVLADFGLTGAAGEPTLTEIINWTRGEDILDVDNDPITTVRYVMGDPLHSQPAAIVYGGTAADPEVVVFSATNDGYFHAIDGTTGVELWSFIPKQFLPDLPELMLNGNSTYKHYGIDGDVVPVVVDLNDNGIIDGSDFVHVIFGLRRGGTEFISIDVTDKDNPVLNWVKSYPEFGQSWSRPVVARVDMVSNTLNSLKAVVILGEGYDTVHDTAAWPGDANPDNVGAGITMLDLFSGEQVWRAGRANADLTIATMTRSMPSAVRVVDFSGDGFIDRMYAVDVGGQVFRFDVFRNKDPADVVTGGVIARFGGEGVATAGDTDTRRFYSAPDVSIFADPVLNRRFIAIGVGSGYRAHPLDTSANDAYFSLRDPDLFAKLDQTAYDNYSIAYESAMHETSGQVNTVIGTNERGWKFTVPSGQMILSSSGTFDNSVFFIGYSPDIGATSSCQVVPGANFLYRVDVANGDPVANNLDSMDPNDSNPARVTTLEQGGIAPSPAFLFPGGEDGCTGAACSPPPLGCIGVECFDPGFANNPVRTLWTQDGIE
jgi:type IV pilus assembly protein PilY1